MADNNKKMYDKDELCDKVEEIADSMAEKLTEEELLVTYADLAMEAAQYALRLGTHHESVYKQGSYMDLFKYLIKVHVFDVAIICKLKDHEQLKQIIDEVVVGEFDSEYLRKQSR